MKKRVFGRKFSRDKGARQVLFRSLATSFIKNDQLETTLPKAKSIKGWLDTLVTKAKKDTLVSRVQLEKELAQDKVAIDKLLKETSARFKGLNSGFTKMARLGVRQGDKAMMVKLTWSRDRQVEQSKPKKSIKKEDVK
ncbi:50S ribosomal protein L17 [Candidatus Microgenomates bacterium]|nr:50S ribosomal protein L17 [Candidatus Microgenomates bacterium]